MIPAFGWSVSDVIEAIELIRKICKAVKATGGAATNYQYVRIELDGLARALRDLAQLDVTEGNAQRIDALRAMALGCRFPLNDFLDKIQKFEPALGPRVRSGLVSAIKSIGRSAQWATYMEEETVKLRAYIAPHVASINLLLQVHAHELGNQREKQRQKDHRALENTLDDVQRTANNSNAQTHRNHAQVLNRVASIKSSSKANSAILADVRKTTDQVASAISDLSDENRDWFKSVMYTNLKNYDAILALQRSISLSPTTITDSNIKFTDALDRHHELPYSYFQVWDVFEAFVKAQFTGVPGSAQVTKGQYRISDSRDSQALITKSNWSQGVFPGSEVTMAVVLSMIRIEEGKCPRPSCGWRVAFSKLTTVDIICPRCGLTYSPELSSTQAAIGTEVEQVIQRQNVEDVHTFGVRRPPVDVEEGPGSSFGYSSDMDGETLETRIKQDDDEVVAELQEEEIDHSDDLEDGAKLKPERAAITSAPVTVIDWNSGESPMAAWLNQSAIPMPDAVPEPIGEARFLDPELLEQERRDLEKLRKVHLSFSPGLQPLQEQGKEFKNMDSAAQPYLRKVIDKFPAIPPFLARRLAETNLRRKRRLAAERAIKSVIGRTDKLDWLPSHRKENPMIPNEPTDSARHEDTVQANCDANVRTVLPDAESTRKSARLGHGSTTTRLNSPRSRVLDNVFGPSKALSDVRQNTWREREFTNANEALSIRTKDRSSPRQKPTAAGLDEASSSKPAEPAIDFEARKAERSQKRVEDKPAAEAAGLAFGAPREQRRKERQSRQSTLLQGRQRDHEQAKQEQEERDAQHDERRTRRRKLEMKTDGKAARKSAILKVPKDWNWSTF